MDHQAHRWKCIVTCKNFSIVPLKLFLTNPVVSVTGLILCITKFIDERIVAHAQTWQKKYIIRIWCKVLIKGQQSLIKVLSRTYWNISRIIISQFILGKKTRKCFLFTNFITEDRNCFFCIALGNNQISPFNYIYNLRNKRCLNFWRAFMFRDL